ncbi:MAG: GTPase HflX [Nitrospiraceae bacterium]
MHVDSSPNGTWNRAQSWRWRFLRRREHGLADARQEGGPSIPTVYGYLNGLKANQLLRLEHLYRRRVPVDKVVTTELARTCTELSHELRREIGLVIGRRGTVERVIVGNGRELILANLPQSRLGQRSLRGVRLVQTHLHNEALNQNNLTTLALLRLDLVAAVGVGPTGLPADIHVAHILPPNPQGQVYEVWPPRSFYQFDLKFDEFIESLESELARASSSHAITKGMETAILISASTRSRADQEERLEELTELVGSAGLVVLETLSQRLQQIHPKYLLGSGKLKEVVMKALQRGADMLIFDQDLSPAQVRAITEVTDMKVIDRTQLILDIFARRAHSREGKIQVELAQLRYRLPRLSGGSTALSRLGGGIGGRGPGETKLETDRRRIRDRIAHLERELQAFKRHRNQRRARRYRHKLPTISIVGYTNAGKSTLLNALTESHVSVVDRPFETLDTSSRRLRFPKDREVIITDTVGFMRDLPKDLMGAFRTTLEELKDADLLLHVVDASYPAFEAQIKTVEAIFAELELDQIPRVLVFNKCDRLASLEADVRCRRYGALGISAICPSTLPPLTELLVSALREKSRASPADSMNPPQVPRPVSHNLGVS